MMSDMNEGSEINDYIKALRDIRVACEKPFGKDARKAKKLATEVLEKWGRKIV